MTSIHPRYTARMEVLYFSSRPRPSCTSSMLGYTCKCPALAKSSWYQRACLLSRGFNVGRKTVRSIYPPGKYIGFYQPLLVVNLVVNLVRRLMGPCQHVASVWVLVSLRLCSDSVCHLPAARNRIKLCAHGGALCHPDSARSGLELLVPHMSR